MRLRARARVRLRVRVRVRARVRARVRLRVREPLRAIEYHDHIGGCPHVLDPCEGVGLGYVNVLDATLLGVRGRGEG